PPGGHTVESMRRIQSDTVGLHVREVLERLPGEVRRGFGSWDGDLSRGSSEAALFGRFVAHLAAIVLPDDEQREDYLLWREPFVCDALPALLDARGFSAEQLDRALAASGPEETVAWGDVH